MAKKRNILSQKFKNHEQNLKVSSKAKVYIYQYFNLFITQKVLNKHKTWKEKKPEKNVLITYTD